jgi:predicted regulator of Ras-like GTPase activity (Roadblock/LC7/MglB family)
MAKSSLKFNATDLNNLLARMNRDGNFPLSVLTDSQGFSIASASNKEMDSEKEAAVIAVIQKSTLQVSRQLGMSATQEIMIHDTEGHCLICRPFDVGGYNMILGLMLDSQQQPYRRLVKQIIREINEIWTV